jgi:hypothetical protein
MNKIPTAEEFIIIYNSKPQTDSLMVAFAKLHVEAALREGYKNKHWSWTNSTDEEVKFNLFMRNSYPLENIK